MINRRVTLTILLLLAVCLAGCGGGSGSSETPPPIDPGFPSVIKLMPTNQVAQTNSTVPLITKVLDGNGNPVPNVQVIYTNLTSLGHLSATTAMTNAEGKASVTLFSSDVGFATIQVEVARGTAWVRDRKVVFYSPFELSLPSGAASVVPTLTLDVDSNANNVFDEPADYILLDGPNNDQALIRATVKDSGGNLLAGDTVTFTADSTEASFPMGRTATTGPSGQSNYGQASVIMQVTPAALRDATTIITVSAVSTVTKAANLVSFFLKPVTVGSITVTANPTTVDSKGTSEITAVVMTSAGTPVPDGTVVNFTATLGAVEPFAQTTDGVAKARWAAPEVTASTTATIRASAAGKSGSVNISITAPVVPPAQLTIVPGSRLIANPVVGNTASYTVTGGTAPYMVVSNSGFVSATITGGNVLATVVSVPTTDTTVILEVWDATGARVSANLVLDVAAAPGLQVIPAARSVNSSASPQTVSFTVSGGTGPYVLDSSNPALVSVPANPDATGAFNATVPANACPGSVTITITDSTGASVTATVTITAPTFAVTPTFGSFTTANGAAPFCVAVSGGVPGYSAVSSSASVTTAPATTPCSGFNISYVGGPLPNPSTTATVTVTDACGGTAGTKTVTVTLGP